MTQSVASIAGCPGMEPVDRCLMPQVLRTRHVIFPDALHKRLKVSTLRSQLHLPLSSNAILRRERPPCIGPKVPTCRGRRRAAQKRLTAPICLEAVALAGAQKWTVSTAKY